MNAAGSVTGCTSRASESLLSCVSNKWAGTSLTLHFATWFATPTRQELVIARDQVAPFNVRKEIGGPDGKQLLGLAPIFIGISAIDSRYYGRVYLLLCISCRHAKAARICDQLENPTRSDRKRRLGLGFDVHAHAARGAFHRIHGGFDRKAVEIGHFNFGDLLHLL